MDLIVTLKSRDDFKKVFEKGKSVVDRFLVLYFLPNNRDYTRFGFSVGKKVGKAVIRNRIKRILRELCRINFSKISPGYDCIIIARGRIVEADFKTIEYSLIKLLKRANLLKRE